MVRFSASLQQKTADMRTRSPKPGELPPIVAIQYGSRTKKHGQYINPNGKVQGRKVKQMEETNEHHDPPHAA